MLKTLEQQAATLIREAQGYDYDILSQIRALSLDYYNGRMIAAPDGRSQIVSTDVRDAIHALMASLAPILKTTILEFEAEDEQQTEQAQAESDEVSKYLAKNNDAIFDSVHDALLTGNGFIKVYVSDDQRSETEQYPADLPDEAIYALMQPRTQGETVKISALKNSTKVVRTVTDRKLMVESVAPERVLFLNSDSMTELSFIAELHLWDADELVEYGLNIEDCAPYGYDNPALNARLGWYIETPSLEGTNEQKYLIFCAYLEDGEGWKRCYLNEALKLLSSEDVDGMPYIIGSAIPVPHRVQGISIFEVLCNIQLGKTEIMRQYLDNLAVANSSRIGAVDGQVNMGDLTNGMINGVVRVKRPDALFPIPSTDIGAQSMAGLGYFDNEISNKIGAVMAFDGVQAQLAGSSATAANVTNATVERMGGWYARNLVMTLLKPVFLSIARLMGIDREDVKINMGLTTIEKAQRVQGIQTVIEMQKLILETGGKDILCNMQNVYNAIGDYCRAMDLDDVSQYFTNPTAPAAQQAAQAIAQQAQQDKAEAAQAMSAVEQVKIEGARVIQMDKLQFEKQKLQVTTQFDYDKLAQDAEIAEAELTVEVVTGDKGANQREESVIG